MYKKECIDELKRYIDIAAGECCKQCEICCESNNCILTKIKDGMANVFGIEIGKGSHLPHD